MRNLLGFLSSNSLLHQQAALRLKNQDDEISILKLHLTGNTQQMERILNLLFSQSTTINRLEALLKAKPKRK